MPPRQHLLHAAPTSLSSGGTWSPRRIAYLLLLFLAALHVSYILENLTYAVFPSPRSRMMREDSIEDRGDLIRYTVETKADPYNYPTIATRAPADFPEWRLNDVVEKIPVVFYYAKPGVEPCHEQHYSSRVVEQALSLNDLVHFIGPPICRQFYQSMGVVFEDYSQYEDVFEWFVRNLGTPVDIHVRWYILKRLMEKFDYPRVFYMATEVMLYANVTEMAAWMYPKSHIVLPVRWPSLRPPARPNQYSSTAVGGHVALFSYPALVDWCLFHLTIFKMQLFGSHLEFSDEDLVLLPQYNDMIAMGWYTFSECWLQEFQRPCLAEKETGIVSERAALLRGKFSPRFSVDSFCMPRRCRNSSWSDEGERVMDNNFSITTATMYFRLRREDKGPSSMKFAYYEAWTKRQQSRRVQFLSVHFQGKKKEFLLLKDIHPQDSWGGSLE
eukprot:TRINITY_DN1666_c0_g1_i3.p1 TRINITY_DN1666_c0_g1~~TRINITY_DN1666_c0_g1_i3.p1  ORF type:complete len:441 (+),score=92.01 TRINITY_DN1666_c0_g1_i3:142-1464(+)